MAASRSLPVWLCLWMACTLAGCSSCTPEDVVSSRETPNHQQSAGYCLAPFLPGVGAPVAFWRDAWEHEPLPVRSPFDSADRPYRLRIGVWMNGTVIWASKDVKNPTHYEAQVDRDTISKLLAKVNPKRYQTATNIRHSLSACLSQTPTVIAFRRDNDWVFIYSLYEGMSLLNEYWDWENCGDRKTFSPEQVSLDEYRQSLSPSFRQYMDDYLHLRMLIKSVIPREGKQIVLHERIRWIMIPREACWSEQE